MPVSLQNAGISVPVAGIPALDLLGEEQAGIITVSRCRTEEGIDGGGAAPIWENQVCQQIVGAVPFRRHRDRFAVRLEFIDLT